MDAWYANNATLWLDVKIFFKTIQTVLFRKNVYTNDVKAADTVNEEVKQGQKKMTEVK